METKTTHEWSRFLDLFLARNRGRPTRLAVFVEEDRGTQDFWIEDGLPIKSVTVETKSGKTDVEIIFGGKSDPDERPFTHMISNAKSLRFELGVLSEDDFLEIRDDKGHNTVLRFENFPGA